MECATVNLTDIVSSLPKEMKKKKGFRVFMGNGEYPILKLKADDVDINESIARYNKEFILYHFVEKYNNVVHIEFFSDEFNGEMIIKKRNSLDEQETLNFTGRLGMSYFHSLNGDIKKLYIFIVDDNDRSFKKAVPLYSLTKACK